ncbi:MAG: fatty acid desaturase [Epibacterium sp.]|nr:fatty acid desaturase [Epibacterium sp.]NQX72672.1 fatty acid desaturase [Epibacterium sp.]
MSLAEPDSLMQSAPLEAHSLPKPASASWQTYSNGVAWPTVIIGIAVMAGMLGVYALAFAGIIPLWLGCILNILLLHPNYTVIIHEAGHGNIAHEVEEMRWLENTIGWIASFFYLFLPYSVAKVVHDHHHAYTNDPDRDPDYFMETSHNLLGLIMNSLRFGVMWPYFALVKRRHHPDMKKIRFSAYLYFVITLGFCVAMFSAGFGAELAMLYIIPTFTAAFLLALILDYVPHAPGRQGDRYRDTRIYHFLGSFWYTLGHSLHLIHHMFPRVPWYHYPKVYRELLPELQREGAPITHGLHNVFYPGTAYVPRNDGRPTTLTMRVANLRKETPNATVVTFANMEDEKLEYRAGQYVTVSKLIGENYVTRCYSVCTAEGSDKLSIGVKRVDGGMMSNFVNSELKVGDRVTVNGPYGAFVRDTPVPKGGDLVLIAGGSGITPILSHIKTALASDNGAPIRLIYANTARGDEMFLKDLAILEQHHGERFKVAKIYNTPPKDWDGESGFLDQAKLERMLKELGVRRTKSQFYICGPTPMKDIVVDALAALKIKPANVTVEEFVMSVPEPEGEVFDVTVRTSDGTESTMQVAENQNILQMAMQNNIRIPHACQEGVCGTCMVKVESGDVRLPEGELPGLLDGEKARGLTLACQCLPTSDLVISDKTT